MRLSSMLTVLAVFTTLFLTACGGGLATSASVSETAKSSASISDVPEYYVVLSDGHYTNPRLVQLIRPMNGDILPIEQVVPRVEGANAWVVSRPPNMHLIAFWIETGETYVSWYDYSVKVFWFVDGMKGEEVQHISGGLSWRGVKGRDLFKVNEADQIVATTAR